MAQTKLVFTCLPDPATVGGAARVSVAVTPRLEGAGAVLGDWSDLAAQPWPEVLQSMPNPVVDIGGLVVEATLAPPRRAAAALDPDAWSAVFPLGTPVTPYVYDRDTRPIRSFGAHEVSDRLRALYKEVAQLGGREPPTVYRDPDAGGGVLSPIDLLVDDCWKGFPWLDDLAAWQTPDYLLHGQLPSGIGVLLRANRFYRRRPPGEAPPGLDEAPPIALPELDFHQRVALIADHPTLQRRLGLVFDLELPVPISQVPPAGTLRVQMQWRGASTLDLAPGARYLRDRDRLFLARADDNPDPDVDRGYLCLASGSKHAFTSMDVDGAALQTYDFAHSVRRSQIETTTPAPERVALPTLRTGGLTITRVRRREQLEMRRAANHALDASSGGVEVFADDVVRGYRVDVKDASGVWRSLCQRVGELRLGDGSGPVIAIPPSEPEEGFVKAASATSTERDDELYLHEAIASWDGWSLCARRPGLTVPPNDLDDPEEIGNEDLGGLAVAAEYRAAPGTLPRLRFGRHYDLRARAVDVAGNSLSPDDDGEYQATHSMHYHRYEPVLPPTLVPRRPFTEGESLERLVVRSVPRETPPGDPCERHVLAPKTTLAMAETHGMLDGALASSTAADLWYHVARKEAGTLIPTQDDATIVDLESRTDVPMTGVVLCRPGSSLDETAPLWPARRGDPLGSGEYVIHTGERVRMPWLPDPLAAGVALWSADATHTQTVAYPTTPVSWAPSLASWPEHDSLRFVLRGADAEAPPRLEQRDARTIDVWIAPGHTVTMRYSSTPHVERLPELALWAMMSPSEQAPIAPDVFEGQHWMYTPPREITFVHAVQRPVWLPELGTLRTTRDPGETALRFQDAAGPSRLKVHGPSTSHLDVRARWVDLVDDGIDPAGVRAEPHAADAFRLPVAYELGELDCVVETESTARAVESAPVPHTVGVRRETVQRIARHELGDTRHRVVTYQAVGTTRYQEYFPPSVIANRENLEAAGPPMPVDVRSSARPPAPRVLYAVPTFGWESYPGGRRRVGGGVRLYLDRPWFASGAGERLAVVLTADSSTENAPYVSRWGQDPMWDAPALPELRAEHFRQTGDDVAYLEGTPDELRAPRMITGAAHLAEDGEPVILVGYLPEWNAERKLWYVDVELATPLGSYWPFVSLALARWQPMSLVNDAVDLQLSAVTRCHYVQVAPDRAASVQRTGDTVQVQLTGFTAGNSLEWLGGRNGIDPPPWWSQYWPVPSHADTSDAAHRVRARLEHCPAGIDPAARDLAWRAVGDPIELRGAWQGSGEVTWSGALSLAQAPSTGLLRVVLTEAEIVGSDPPGPLADLGAQGSQHLYEPARERVVYLDAFGI